MLVRLIALLLVASVSPVMGDADQRYRLRVTPAVDPDACTVTSDGSDTNTDALADAATDGAVVCLPAGTYDWDSNVSITKAITLKGSGVGVTIIRDAIVARSALVTWSLVPDQPSRMTGITFSAGISPCNSGTQNFNGVFAITGTSGSMRVDNNYFDHVCGVQIVPKISGTAVVLIDNNDFYSTPTNQMVRSFAEASNTSGATSDAIWAAVPGFGGSTGIVFIEDNHLEYDGASDYYAFTDGFNATRVVIRGNTGVRGWFEVHGEDSTPRGGGGRAVEAYLNNVDCGNNSNGTLTEARSGAWIIFSNTWTNCATGGMRLSAYRTNSWYGVFGGADGTNGWDKNVGGGPFLTGTVTSAGSLTFTVSGAGWTPSDWIGYTVHKTSGRVSCASVTHNSDVQRITYTFTCNSHGLSNGSKFSVRGANQSQYMTNHGTAANVTANTFTSQVEWSQDSVLPTTPATGTITVAPGQDYGYISANTTDTMTFTGSTYIDLTFTAGDTFELWRVDKAMHQPCSGQGTTLDGKFMPFPYPSGWPNFVIEACYEWSNTRNGSDLDFSSIQPFNIVENEDFFNDVPTGVRASRPAASVEGEGYWSTDQGGNWNTTSGGANDGCLDKVVSGSWVNCYYTPYTYPHPLQAS